MSPKPSHYDTAERIIRTQGFAFAEACAAGNSGPNAFARDNLKQAIANALADEFESAYREQRG